MLDYRKKIGTKDKPLQLKTPPGSTSYTRHVDEKDGTDILVCTVGTTVLHYGSAVHRRSCCNAQGTRRLDVRYNRKSWTLSG